MNFYDLCLRNHQIAQINVGRRTNNKMKIDQVKDHWLYFDENRIDGNQYTIIVIKVAFFLNFIESLANISYGIHMMSDTMQFLRLLSTTIKAKQYFGWIFREN